MTSSLREMSMKWLHCKGNAALECGNLDVARHCFEYILRVRPGDTALAVILGNIQLLQGDVEATTTFKTLAEKHDLREAWFGLAAATRRTAPAEAATWLAHGLARHAPLSIPGFNLFADRIAQSAGAAGWCGLTASGRLRVSTAAGSPTASVAVLLDGKPTPIIPATGRGGTEFDLPCRLWGHSRLEVLLAGRHLLGSPIRVSHLTRVEGLVREQGGGLTGWIATPGDPEAPLDVTVSFARENQAQTTIIVPTGEVIAFQASPWLRRRFDVPRKAVADADTAIAVLAPNGRHLLGSPIALLPRGTGAGTSPRPMQAVPRTGRPRPPRGAPTAPATDPHLSPVPAPARPVDIIVPVYRGLTETMACLRSVLASKPATGRVIVVEDCSPDPALRRELGLLAAAGRIGLIRLPENRGYPGAVNAGLAACRDSDVVLLNSDTLVANAWIERLREACRAAPDIGTVTPFTNDGTVVSYPLVNRTNPALSLPELTRLDQQASRANGRATVDIPTAVGFCMLIRRECLEAVGPFREDVFAQGYGEENDFSVRARKAGWRNVALPGVVVAHLGARSFGTAKAHLISRNIAVLNRLHPGYDRQVAQHVRRDPLAGARRRLDLQRWSDLRDTRRSVVLVSHGRGGGVQRHLRARCQIVQAAGMRPIILRPATVAGRLACTVDVTEPVLPNLTFDMAREFASLAALLAACRVENVEIHHFLDHDPKILSLGRALGVPVDVVIHDYAWVCAQVCLTGPDQRYCGEPGLAGCDRCVAAQGSQVGDVSPAELQARSLALLRQARAVIVPSHDVARRLRRSFPTIAPEVRPWEARVAGAEAVRAKSGPVRICVAGAIGPHKGYDRLLGLLRDARARALALEYVLVGHSYDDLRLLQGGNIHITGPFKEGECVDLLRRQRADCGFLPSEIPETWCYALTDLWRAGLPVAAFDIGTQGERLRRSETDLVLPLGLPAPRINDILLNWGRVRRLRDARIVAVA